MLRLLLAAEIPTQKKVWPNTFVLHGIDYTVLVGTQPYYSLLCVMVPHIDRLAVTGTSTWTTPRRFTFSHYDIATKSTRTIKPWDVKYRLLFAPVGVAIEREEEESRAGSVKLGDGDEGGLFH